MLINLQFKKSFPILLALIQFVNSECPPIPTILNGQLIVQPDPICLGRENPTDLIKCPPLNNPLNGYIIGLCQPLTGFTCKFGCLNGLTLSHPNSLTCLSSGQWSSPVPVCDNYSGNDCDLNSVKTMFKNGFINCSQNEKSQLVCRFQCYNGYILTGNSILTCQSNGKFNGLSPTCVLVENKNSLIEYNHSPLTSPNVMVYSKPFNYFVTANSIQCSQLSTLKSGSTNCDCSAGNIQYGCVCRFFCNENYYLIGSPMIQCTKFGNWSSSNPVCRRGSACSLPENLNKNVFLLHCDTSFNGKCFYRCKGSVYFIDSTGKISKNRINLNKNMLESENRSFRQADSDSRSSYDFTLKTNRCSSSGSWSNDFVCDVDEEINSLNKLNLTSSDEDRVSSTIFKRRRRRRRRRPNRGRLVPMRLGSNRRTRRRRPTRRRQRNPNKRRSSLNV